MKLNKEIIAELISNEPKARAGALEKMNQENKFLQIQINTIKSQRDDLHAKLLISNQIIEEFKAKEHEHINEENEKIKDLLDQLNQKEFVLQSLEQKYNKAEGMLKKFSCQSLEVCMLLRELGSEQNYAKIPKISNVIEENKNLRAEIENQKKIIEKLEKANEKTKNNKVPSLETASFASSDKESQYNTPQIKAKTAKKKSQRVDVNTHLCARIAELEEEKQELVKQNEDLLNALKKLQKALVDVKKQSKELKTPDPESKKTANMLNQSKSPNLPRCPSFGSISNITIVNELTN